RLGSEQRGGHLGKRGVLGAAHADLARQLLAACDVQRRVAATHGSLHRAPKTRWKALSPTRSGEAQPGLRHSESVLELGLLRSRQGSRKLLLRAAPCLLGLLDRYLVGVLGDVGEDGDSIRKDLEEPAAHEEQLLVAAVSDLQGAWLQDRHQGRVSGQDAQLSVRSVRDDEIDVALEQAPL